MFKSICAKAIVPVAVAVTGFVVVGCLLLYGAIKKDMTSSVIQYSSALADTVVQSTRYAMLRSDRETIRNIVKNIGDQKSVEHVRIFNKKGLIMFSKDPSEVNHLVDKTSAGCRGCHATATPKETLAKMQEARSFVDKHHIKVLAITAPIYNKPECYTAACHFHRSGPKLLGILDIGLNRAPLDNGLSALGMSMLVFSFMILLLTVGGVSALLKKNVFTPIRQLTDFTENMADGNLSTEAPKVCGDLEKLGSNFQKIVQQNRQTASDLKHLEDIAGAKSPQSDLSSPSDDDAARFDDGQHEQEVTHGESIVPDGQKKGAGSESSLPGTPGKYP